MDGVDTAIIVAIIAIAGSIIAAVVNTGIIQPWRARKDREVEKKEQKQEQDNRKTELQNALYSEMGYTYCTLMRFIIDLKKQMVVGLESAFPLKASDSWFDNLIDTLGLIMNSGFDVYKFTRNDPVLFYQLHSASALDEVYRALISTINNILHEFHHFKEMRSSLNERSKEGRGAAYSLRETLDTLYNALKRILSYRIKARYIDIVLLLKFVTNEEDKKFLNELISE